MNKTVPNITFTGNVGIVRANNSPYVGYLKDALGKILPKALNDISERRPSDPIEELARWLYQWADCELYFYEKAIFAKELQLLALHVEKENTNRMAKLVALKKEMGAIKNVLADDKAMALLLWKQKAGKDGVMGEGLFDDDLLRAWAKQYPEDMSGADVSGGGSRGVSFIGSELAAGRRGRRRGDSFGSDESRLDFERRRRRRKFGEGEDEDEWGRKRKRGKKGSEYDVGGYRRRRTGTFAEEWEEEEDLYGPAAKLKYGFACTPVRCTWYLIQPNVLVCVHPVLGEIRAPLTVALPFLESPDYWEKQNYNLEIMYDHELYINMDPHFDDDVYQDQMIAWAENDWVKEYSEKEDEAKDEVEAEAEAEAKD